MSLAEDNQNNQVVHSEEQVVEEVRSSIQKRSATYLEELSMSMMNGSMTSGIDLSDFTSEQKDKVLALIQQSEDNAFNYSIKKLDVSERLKSKALDASIVNQKTLRYVVIGLIMAAFVLFILILFFKEEYFGVFLSFITGLCGGAGIRELFARTKQSPPVNTDAEAD